MATKKKTTTTAKTKTTAPAKTAPSKSLTMPRIRPRDLIIPAIIAIILIFLWMNRKEFVVATVNGSPITRLALVNEVEKRDGKAVLEELIQQNLVLQEAAKRKVEVSDKEVNTEIANIEKSFEGSGQTLDLMLAQRGMTRDDLTTRVRMQTLLKKMMGDIKVSDKELNDYIEQNKASMPEGTDIETLKPQIKAQLEQEKAAAKSQEFLAELEKKAKVIRLKNY